jgi:hypothetical protein
MTGLSDRPFRCAAVVLLFAVAAPAGARGQTSSSTGDGPEDATPPKAAFAVGLDAEGITVDGRLDDAAWLNARFLTDFKQKEPDQGADPTERTELAFLFDDGALYVGARMHHSDPDSIARVMTRRDELGNVETLIVSLDTYFDRRTAYSFAVTAAGVRADWYHPGDREHDRDFTFNPVWEAHVNQDAGGWTAEMRIPFSQLRFNDTERWGINVNRWIPTKNEDIYWVYVPREETGWSSRFGELTGVEGVKSSSRKEFMPYVATDTRLVSGELVDEDDPFGGRTSFDGRIGADFKMGLGPNLTLDATVNPDFGQVEADPAVVNLSAFEVVFDERRPFFVEGSQLLGGGRRMGPSYYYSRRIGGAPHGFPEADFVDHPNATTILGAAKVTGRMSNGLSVGVLGALTSAEHARTYDAGLDRFDDIRVEPMAGWGVMRLQQEVGGSGSTIGLMATGVKRQFDGVIDPLRGELNEQAFTGGSDFQLRLDGNRYEVSGHFGLSYVSGDEEAIANVQLSSAHYFERPDQDHVTFDPTRTSLFGTSASLQVRKVEGEHWLWQAGVWGDSPTWELNDIGLLRQADDIAGWANVTYRETDPGSWYRNYAVTLATNQGWNFGGIHKQQSVNLFSNVQLNNYWRTGIEGQLGLATQNDRLTRGGPLMGQPTWGAIGTFVRNNHTSKVRWRANGMWGNLNGGNDWFLNFGIEFEPTDRFGFSVAPGVSWETNERQYYTTLDRETDRTFGQRYVFSTVDQKTVSMRLRANYSFSPDLNLELYAEPFASSGKFTRFGELPEARSFDLRTYGTDGTTIEEVVVEEEDGSTTRAYEVTDGDETFTLEDFDFNSLSFRSNLVLRWELRPGSTLFVVWQRNLSDYANVGDPVNVSDMFSSLGAAGQNILAIKLSYWIPM